MFMLLTRCLASNCQVKKQGSDGASFWGEKHQLQLDKTEQTFVQYTNFCS